MASMLVGKCCHIWQQLLKAKKYLIGEVSSHWCIGTCYDINSISTSNHIETEEN